jgi:hypothetical protein
MKYKITVSVDNVPPEAMMNNLAELATQARTLIAANAVLTFEAATRNTLPGGVYWSVTFVAEVRAEDL